MLAERTLKRRLQTEQWRVEQSYRGPSRRLQLISVVSARLLTRARSTFIPSTTLRLLAMILAGRQHAPNSEYALNSEVRLITRFYGISMSCHLLSHVYLVKL